MSALVKNPFNHDLPAAETPLVNVQVNGQWVQVPKGLNAIEVAHRHNHFVPHYCYHPKLSISGNCRMCLIELGTPKLDAQRQPVLAADGKPEIAWMPRPQIGCSTNVTEGMALRTDSPLVRECREGVMEFLLINHPLDCPICDQAGECKLQEFSYDHGHAGSRFVEDKVRKPKQQDIGERIVLDDERCIMCSRCVRFAHEMLHDDVLGFTERGSHTTLAVHPGQRFDHNYSLNTVDICPVGALTTKDFRFKMRVWFLKETKSICTGCATGCNILIGSRENLVHRLTPRPNEEVNSHWMCDQGRLGFHYLHDERRLTEPQVGRGEERRAVSWKELWTAVTLEARKYNLSEIAVIASAKLTNEELYFLRLLLQTPGGQAVLVDTVPRAGQADGILRSADLNPNTNGVKLLGIGQGGINLLKIKNGIDEGKIKFLYVLHEDAVAAGIPAETLRKLDVLMVQEISATATTELATHLLPGAGFAEKRGTMINVGRRLQRLNKAIAAPGQAREDWEILRDLCAIFGLSKGLRTVDEVFLALTQAVPELAGLSYSKIGDLGVPLIENPKS